MLMMMIMLWFLGLQIQLVNVAILTTAASATSSLAAAAALPPPPPPPPNSFPIAKPNCTSQCGNVRIPFPFGTTMECSLNYDFLITCNETFNPPKPVFYNTTIKITDISLDGQLTVLQFIGHDCYNESRSRVSYADPTITLFPFTVNNTANKFTIVGCDTYGFVSGVRLDGRNYSTGCTATCYAEDDLEEGSCTGIGCCQTSIPKQVSNVELELSSYGNYSYVRSFNNCSYAFVVEERAFNFSPKHLTSLKDVVELPMVVDWDIGNGTCEEAQRNSSAYACKSGNSTCYKPSNGVGYRCACLKGYQGNPYLVDGCRDIDECQDQSLCERSCVNTPGGYRCECPKGYHGDGKRGGQGCIPGESLVFKLVAGVALGVIVLLVPSCWLHWELKRRRLIKTRRKFFLQNGGLLLQEKLTEGHRSSVAARIFSATELQKATNNFHSSRIVGRGGYGTVYKGVLPDNTVVAIKKSKEVAPKQIEQFINEVIVLSQVNHRNVVKLLGCCLETQAPLLVYEFVNNGTLFEHVHNQARACCLSWDMRLRIATETAGVLSYLHSAASTPIIHRDVKSANILVDHTFTAKVSDFGASRLFPLDQTELTTLVQGTFGYLDPEYMQTSQLTEKSDVYSFGVVLVELLTGRKAVSNDRPEEERSLANFFLSVMKQDRLFQVLEDNVVREGNEEQLMRVAALARSCLKVKGDDRPSMKDVAMELEGLRVGGKHSWLQTREIAEDEESLLCKEFSGFINGEGSSTSVGFDGLTHSVLSMDGGR